MVKELASKIENLYALQYTPEAFKNGDLSMYQSSTEEIIMVNLHNNKNL